VTYSGKSFENQRQMQAKALIGKTLEKEPKILQNFFGMPNLLIFTQKYKIHRNMPYFSFKMPATVARAKQHLPALLNSNLI